MPAPPIEQIRVARYAEEWGYSAVEWTRALRSIDWSGDRAVLLKKGAQASVWQCELSLGARRAPFVIKVQRLSGPAEIVKAWLGGTRAHRQWRGERLLRRHRFDAARCRAILRGHHGDARVEALVLEPVDGRTLLEILAADDAPAPDQHVTARSVGTLIRRLIDAGLVNRDSKPSNLVIDGGRRASIVLLDTVAIRRIPAGAERRALRRMLRDLLLEPIGTGCTPRRSLMMKALRHAHAGEGSWRAFRNRTWRRVAASIAEHGNSTPTDDPLWSG